MSDNLVKVKFNKNGRIKEINSRIAYDKNYQKSHDFVPLDEAGSASSPVEPQKKISANVPSKKDVAATDDNNEELGAGVETEAFDDGIETVEEKVIRLHKEGKSEQGIKTETGINMNTIRSVIKKIK